MRLLPGSIKKAMMTFSTSQLRCVQREFADRFVDAPGVLGIRIKRYESGPVIVVTVDQDKLEIEMPSVFKDVPVRIVEGAPAVLAYALSA